MAEKEIRYLLTVIKNSDFTPRWPDIAHEFDINTASNAQRRFKSIVEKAGFKLENGKQVTSGAPLTENAIAAAGKNSTTNGGSAPQTPKKPRKKGEPGSSAKRRKSNKGKAVKPESEDEGGDPTDGQDSKLDGDDVEDGNGETA